MSNHPSNIALIGHGEWGRILFRNLCLYPDFIDHIFIVSRNEAKYLETAKNPHIKTSLIPSVNNLLQNLETVKLDGVVIATPPSSRLEVIKKIIPSCKNFFCEKPVSLNMGETSEILKLIKEHKCKFIVDYVHLFSNEFFHLKQNCILKDGFNIFCQSGNWGPFRNYSVLWDYGPHDLSLILALVNKTPEKVRIHKTSTKDAKGLSCIIELFFKKGKAVIDLSNQRTSKTRYMRVDSYKTWILDDTKKVGKLTVSGTSVTLENIRPLARAIGSFINVLTPTYETGFFLNLAKIISEIITSCEFQITQV